MASILGLVTVQLPQLPVLKSYPIKQDSYSWDLHMEAKIKPLFTFKSKRYNL